jgi:hypothetical protein
MGPVSRHPDRRSFLLQGVAGGLFAATYASAQPSPKPGIPGPFPGRVVSVEHAGIVSARKYQREAVRSTISKGLMELTGAPTPQEAWR